MSHDFLFFVFMQGKMFSKFVEIQHRIREALYAFEAEQPLHGQEDLHALKVRMNRLSNVNWDEKEVVNRQGCCRRGLECSVQLEGDGLGKVKTLI